jgi:ABC-type glycerol-3-phosphate transport system substrate-binding protein
MAEVKKSKKLVSRRAVLKGLGASALGVAATALVACQPKTVVVEKEVEKTVIVEKEVTAVVAKGPVEINVIVGGWQDTQWNISRRANAYNAEQDRMRVNIIPTPQGWDTKIMSQIEKGEPAWDGILTHHPFRVSVQWLAQGMIAPINDFLDATSVLNMDDFWADAIAPDLIKFDCSVKNAVVGVPLGIDTCCQAFRADLMEAAGLPHTREEVMEARSWDQITDWALALRETHKGDQVWGVVNHSVYHQSLGQIYQSISDDMFYDDGLIKWDSDEMKKAVEIQANWSWSGAAPTPAWSGGVFIDGKAGYWVGQVGVVGAAQRGWGLDRIPRPMPAHVEGGTGGSQWYTTAGYVFNKAKNPQEVVDFYLYMFGPQNDENAKLCVEYNWFPVFQSQWEKLIDPDPELQWCKDFLPQFKNAKLIPRNPYYEIQWRTIRDNSELVMAKKLDVDEACENTMEEVRDQVSKLKIEW